MPGIAGHQITQEQPGPHARHAGHGVQVPGGQVTLELGKRRAEIQLLLAHARRDGGAAPVFVDQARHFLRAA